MIKIKSLTNIWKKNYSFKEKGEPDEVINSDKHPENFEENYNYRNNWILNKNW